MFGLSFMPKGPHLLGGLFSKSEHNANDLYFFKYRWKLRGGKRDSSSAFWKLRGGKRGMNNPLWKLRGGKRSIDAKRDTLWKLR